MKASETEFTISSAKVNSSGDAESYTFWFDPYKVKVNMLLCEASGQIAFDTCYGQFMFAWPKFKHRGGCSLKRFLFERQDFHYMMDKFSYGRKREFEVFDFDQSVAHLKDSIKDGSHDDEEIKALLEYVDEEFDSSADNLEAWILQFPSKNQAIGETEQLFAEWYSDEPWEYAIFDNTNHQKLFRDKILPCVATWILENVDLDSNCKEVSDGS